mgnify:CR=1 FL=1
MLHGHRGTVLHAAQRQADLARWRVHPCAQRDRGEMPRSLPVARAQVGVAQGEDADDGALRVAGQPDEVPVGEGCEQLVVAGTDQDGVDDNRAPALRDRPVQVVDRPGSGSARGHDEVGGRRRDGVHVGLEMLRYDGLALQDEDEEAGGPDAALVGRKVECVFDPFDLIRIEIRVKTDYEAALRFGQTRASNTFLYCSLLFALMNDIAALVAEALGREPRFVQVAFASMPRGGSIGPVAKVRGSRRGPAGDRRAPARRSSTTVQMVVGV